jgi:hypothetical protein
MPEFTLKSVVDFFEENDYHVKAAAITPPSVYFNYSKLEMEVYPRHKLMNVRGLVHFLSNNGMAPIKVKEIGDKGSATSLEVSFRKEFPAAQTGAPREKTEEPGKPPAECNEAAG